MIIIKQFLLQIKVDSILIIYSSNQRIKFYIAI